MEVYLGTCEEGKTWVPIRIICQVFPQRIFQYNTRLVYVYAHPIFLVFHLIAIMTLIQAMYASKKNRSSRQKKDPQLQIQKRRKDMAKRRKNKKGTSSGRFSIQVASPRPRQRPSFALSRQAASKSPHSSQVSLPFYYRDILFSRVVLIMMVPIREQAYTPQASQVPHGRPPMRTIPRLIQPRHLPHQSRHLRLRQGTTDHDAGAACTHGEHFADFGGAGNAREVSLVVAGLAGR